MITYPFLGLLSAAVERSRAFKNLIFTFMVIFLMPPYTSRSPGLPRLWIDRAGEGEEENCDSNPSLKGKSGSVLQSTFFILSFWTLCIILILPAALRIEQRRVSFFSGCGGSLGTAGRDITASGVPLGDISEVSEVPGGPGEVGVGRSGKYGASAETCQTEKRGIKNINPLTAGADDIRFLHFYSTSHIIF